MNKLKSVLAERGIKQSQLAKQLNIAKSTVSQWCSNTSQPTLATLFSIADVLDCSVVDLLNLKHKEINK